MKDYSEIVRRSIRKDFAHANFNAREPKTQKKTHRVLELGKPSGYYQFRKYIVGKLVRIIGPGSICGTWVEFVHDADRDALNKAGGWTDKRQYLLDCVKFDE